MAVYTKEQINLINEIRRLDKKAKFACNLDYEDSVKLLCLIKEANAQNLCWW